MLISLHIGVEKQRQPKARALNIAQTQNTAIQLPIRTEQDIGIGSAGVRTWEDGKGLC